MTKIFCFIGLPIQVPCNFGCYPISAKNFNLKNLTFFEINILLQNIKSSKSYYFFLICFKQLMKASFGPL